MTRNPLYEICGVYAIICADGGSIYIGATGSSFGTRWSQHRVDQRSYHSNSGGNRRLRAAYARYGPDSFCYVILEIVPCSVPKRYLRQRERHWFFWFRDHWGDDRMLNLVTRITLLH